MIMVRQQYESGDVLGDENEFIASEGEIEASRSENERIYGVDKKRKRKDKENWKRKRVLKELKRKKDYEVLLSSAHEQIACFNQMYSNIMGLSELEEEENLLRGKSL
jgi:hypothetical protein